VAITPGHLWDPPIEDTNLVWTLSPEALRDLTDEGDGEYDYHESISVERLHDLPNIWKDDADESPIVGEHYRHLVIQLRPFVAIVMGHVMAVRPDLEPTMLWADLEARLLERGLLLKSLIAELDKGGLRVRHP
jgi:hypothetical protein